MTKECIFYFLADEEGSALELTVLVPILYIMAIQATSVVYEMIDFTTSSSAEAATMIVPEIERASCPENSISDTTL